MFQDASRLFFFKRHCSAERCLSLFGLGLIGGDSVQTIWLAGRHSDPFTLDNTVLRCLTVAPLGMFLLAYLFDTYLLIFEGHAS